jgi:hypothetical protein
MTYRMIPVPVPPCPNCKGYVPILKHYRERKTQRVCIQHIRRCPEIIKRWRKSKDPEWSWLNETRDGRLNEWSQKCWAAIQAARARLSYEEIHRRQVLAGKKLTRKQRQLGGRNQKIEDKARGGKYGSHRRWHVKRGIFVKGCPWCRRFPRE